MKSLVQRVKESSISIDGSVVSHIGKGIVIFLGIAKDDTAEDARYLAQRCANLRIFDDSEQRMNLTVKDVSGSAMVVSQFTLYADTKKGNRPSFIDAAPPESAEPLYQAFVGYLREGLGEQNVQTGKFRTTMAVHLINDGPVTIMVESK